MKILGLLLPLALSACGTLPEPFYGNPGAEGARLAVPPAPVLMVAPPVSAKLSTGAATIFAQNLANQLADLDVPSLTGTTTSPAWHLEMTANISDNQVLPIYQIIGPNGKAYGEVAGAGEPAAEWVSGNAGTLGKAAATDAPVIEVALAKINAQIQQSNPNSLENRLPRLYLTGVSGAPGDGDSALALNMARDMPAEDTQLVDRPADADFVVTGLVKTKPDGNRQWLVELDWSVFDSNHRKIGQVTQLHDLSPSDITPYWGDVAAAAAAEAASGVHEVVEKAMLHHSSDKTP